MLCEDCGTEWSAHTGGIAGRLKQRCNDCYLFYRKAVTLLYAADSRAKKKSLPFDLDVEWIMERLKKTCPVTDCVFALKNTGNNYSNRSPFTPSIDKIDPALGYTKDNCRLVIWWYNSAKQQLTDEETIKLCKIVSTSTTDLVKNAGVPMV